MAIKSRVRTLAIMFLLLFAVPVVGLSRFQVFEADTLSAKSGNTRNLENLALRGSILDRRMAVLAQSREGYRYYPLAQAAAPLLGYFTARLGAAGLEASFVSWTAGFPIPRTPVQAMTVINKGNRMGDDVVLTIDSQLQQQVYDALSGYRGAAVVLKVKSGELLALASRPSYDANPKALEADWADICSSPSAPLVERCTQGLYPPGSTFKLLTMCAGLGEGKTSIDEVFNCSGKVDVGNFVLNCNDKHDAITLREGLIYSCNVVFAQVGLRVGLDDIRQWMKKLGFDEELPLVPGAVRARLPEQSSPSAAAESAIGQADLLVSPLHMARLAAIVGRGGLDVEPRLVMGRSRQNMFVWQPEAPVAQRLVDAAVCAQVKEAASAVVLQGTGRRAAITGVSVAGKTGSAENPHGDPHAWFVGYAPADNPVVAVAVVLENAGGGGRYAAPVAKTVLEAALARIQ